MLSIAICFWGDFEHGVEKENWKNKNNCSIFLKIFDKNLKQFIKISLFRAWEYHQRFLHDERFRNQYSKLIFVD